MKRNRKGRWVLLLVLAVAAALAAAVFFNLPKPQAVSDGRYDLAALPDGRYQGECSNGLVYAKVEVELRDRSIAKVRILEHRNGLGQAGEAVADTVVQRQSIEVDAVTGATYSSQTILKAIENALLSNKE